MSEHLQPEQISNYASRKLTPEQRLQVRNHIATCEDCRARLRDSYQNLSTADLAMAILGTNEASEHLSEEELRSYVEGKAEGRVAERVKKHLETCEKCRAEESDYRTFHNYLQTLPQQAFAPLSASQRLKHLSKASWAHRSPPSTRSRILVLVAVTIFLFLGYEFQGERQHLEQHLAQANQQLSRSTQRLQELEANSISTKQEKDLLSGWADIYGEFRSSNHATMGSGTPDFYIQSPPRQSIANASPEFRWTAKQGASQYIVRVYVDGQEKITSPALTQTHWTPSQPLPQGKNLKCVVEARLSDGSTSYTPTNGEYLFRVLSPNILEQEIQARYSLAITCISNGRFQEAKEGLSKIVQDAPNSPASKKALQLLKALDITR